MRAALAVGLGLLLLGTATATAEPDAETKTKGGGVAITFEAEVPDEDAAGWRAAFAAVEARIRAGLPADAGPRAYTLEPQTDPGGGTLPYYVRYCQGDGCSVVLVTDGTVIEVGAGAEAARAALAAAGFPKKPLSRHLVADVLAYTGVIGAQWWTFGGHWARNDERYTVNALPLPSLKMHPKGATLVMQRNLSPEDGGGVAEPVRHTLTVTFDASARFTVETTVAD